MAMRRLVMLGFAGLLALGVSAAEPSVRWRGFNLLDMFIWEEGHALPAFHEEDFALIREWGFNFVRLPVDYRFWTHGGDWGTIDEAWVEPIDRAIELGAKYGVHVQLNLHRAPGYCINLGHLERKKLFEGNAEARAAFTAHWAFFAKRYASVPADRLSFDLVNEPPGVEEVVYVGAVSDAIAAIRSVSPDRIIVSDGRFGGNVPTDALLGERGIVQAMRGYVPMNVTHYLADWVEPEVWGDGVPTWPPADGGAKAKYDDPGLDFLYRNNYARWDAFAAKGGKVILGEFGVYNRTPHAVALAAIEANLRLVKERNWSWALWELRGDFGVLDSGRKDVDYEDFRGHKLDRKLLDILLAY